MKLFVTPENESEVLRGTETKVIRNSDKIIYLETKKKKKYILLLDHVFIEDILKRKDYVNKTDIKNFTLYNKKFDYVTKKKGVRWYFVCPECRFLTRVLYIYKKNGDVILCCTSCAEKKLPLSYDSNTDKEFISLVTKLITLKREIKNNAKNKKIALEYTKKYIETLKKVESHPSFRIWKAKKIY